MSDDQNQKSPLQTIPEHSWFLILCSWEYEHDAEALDKWVAMYKFFKPKKSDVRDPLRDEISDKGLLVLNLIGKRKFVIAGQAKSNKPLQKISKIITWKTAIKVDVFAATNVFEFGEIHKKIDKDYGLI